MKHMISLEFAELHTPLFLGGKNFGLKLNSKLPSDPLLVYCRRADKLYVVHCNKLAIIPSSNVVTMTPVDAASFIQELTYAVAQQAVQEPAEPQKLDDQSNMKPALPKKQQSAQVSTPTSHVFGEGAGKKRD